MPIRVSRNSARRGRSSERRQKPHATETPREKALTANLFPAVGQEPDQRLQGAVEQGRVNQIRPDILGDGRGIEMCDRSVRSSDFDQAHGSKASAVIEPREPRQVIEGLLVDPTASWCASRKAQRPAGIGFRAETSNRMNRKRFVRQARAARQLPIAFLGADHGAHLAHSTLVEWQRAAHFEIAQFEYGRVRPLRSRSGASHLQNSSRRKDRHALDRMVADPRQHLLVEVVDPARYRTALTKTEKRVLERRIYRIGALGREAEPEALTIPRIERQPTRIGHPVEERGLREIGSGDVAIGGNCGKWVAIERLARKGGEHAPIHFRRTQSIGQIGLQNCRRADLKENAVAFGRQECGGLRKAHRAADIAPPVAGVERVVLNRLPGHGRYQPRRRMSG